MENLLTVTMIPGAECVMECKNVTEEEYSNIKAMIDGKTVETIKAAYGVDSKYINTLCVEIPSSLIATDESTDVFSIDGVAIDKNKLKEQGFDCIICVPASEPQLRLQVSANTKDSLSINIICKRS